MFRSNNYSLRDLMGVAYSKYDVVSLRRDLDHDAQQANLCKDLGKIPTDGCCACDVNFSKRTDAGLDSTELY